MCLHIALLSLLGWWGCPKHDHVNPVLTVWFHKSSGKRLAVLAGGAGVFPWESSSLQELPVLKQFLQIYSEERQFNDLNVRLVSYLAKMSSEDLKSCIFDISVLNCISVFKIVLRLCIADDYNIWDAAAP